MVPTILRDPIPTAARARTLPRTVVLLAILVAVLLAGAPAALAAPPRSIAVEDTTGDLDAAPLTERLQQVGFREPVDVVALSIDVTALGENPSNDRALNDAVLAYARQKHTDWLTSGGAYWRDGLVIIAIDPRNRFIGSYAGEDVKLPGTQATSVEDAMRPVARDADWNGAVVAGAQKYAALLDRPFWMSGGFLIGGAVAVLALGAAILAALARGASARGTVRGALPRYDDVMLHYAETELAARTIPPDSRYGEPVLRDYEEFTRRASEATALREQIPGHRGLLWGVSSRTADLARRFAAATAEVDRMDDEIVATNDLLSHSNRWRDAWEREIRPIRDSLAQVDTAVAQEPALADAPTARDLRQVAANVERGLTTTTDRLERGEMSGDDALQELDLMTAALGKAATAHRDSVIAATARSNREAELMRGSGGRYGGPAYGTIRGRRHYYHPTMYDPFWSLSPILWLSSWQTSASSDLDTYRNPPATSSSSSGGFTGYSGGGGGFSGAGSSGRF